MINKAFQCEIFKDLCKQYNLDLKDFDMFKLDKNGLRTFKTYIGIRVLNNLINACELLPSDYEALADIVNTVKQEAENVTD